MTFGDFTSFCETAPLPLCASVGHITSISNGVGIEANCYARNIELANTIIFQMAASAIHILALVMTVIMILHVRGKFTAVGMLLWRSPGVLLLVTLSEAQPAGLPRLRENNTLTMAINRP